jgi:hydroxymethylglutaryl-CoA lyase
MGVRDFDSSGRRRRRLSLRARRGRHVATEDLIYMMNGLGIQTGVDLDKIIGGRNVAEQIIGRPLPEGPSCWPFRLRRPREE